jgi:precorrin-4 methylase
MKDFRDLLTDLASAKVEFIVVDGVAAIAHGAARLTQDLDEERQGRQ